MTEETDRRATDLAEHTADIVSAFVGNNSVPVAGLADLIASVHQSLSVLGQPAEPAPVPQTPAVNPKKSVFPDYIISLEDGRRFKSMKRYLRLHGMTPDQYRAKWGLPGDYPIVAPNYAARRSALAKSLGLGRKAAGKPAKTYTAKKKTAA
jgi:predicted transcriptional regulator